MRRFFLLGVAAASLQPVFGQGLTNGDFTYTVTNGAAMITRYLNTTNTSVEIPATLDSLPVTSIGNGAFMVFFFHTNSLTNVVIPEGVTKIGSMAFYGSHLRHVALPASVTNVGGAAFRGSTNLQTIQFSSATNLASIEVNAFDGCTALTQVTLPQGLTTLGNTVFAGCSALSSAHLPASLTKLGTGILMNCASLTQVVLPPGLTDLPDGTFYGCSQMAELNLPDGITRIGADALGDCGALGQLTLPANLVELGERALAGCRSLTNVAVPAGNTNFSSLAGVLYNVAQDRLILYPAGRTQTNFALPHTVSVVGARAFQGAVHLRGATLPAGLTAVEDEGFAETGLRSITLGNGVISLGAGVFRNCGALTNAVLGAGITTIPEAAFHSSTNLAGVTLADGLTSIGRTAFFGCAALPQLSIPDSVTEIGEFAFSGCVGLTSLDLGEGVEVLGEEAFSGCTGLTAVHLPASVTTLWRYVFGAIPGLGSYTVAEANTHFAGIDGVLLSKDGKRLVAYPPARPDTAYEVPAGVEEIGEGAFEGNRFLSQVALGAGVKRIEDSAFYGCEELTVATIGAGVESIGFHAFRESPKLAKVFFLGNAPETAGDFHFYETPADIYILPGATGWGAETGSRPVSLVPVGEIFASPNRFGLYEEWQYQAHRELGRQDVLGSPALYGLYTTNQIHSLGLGGIVLGRNTNNELVLNLRILQSEDLQNWTTYQEQEVTVTNAPANRLFLRVQTVDQP